MSHLSDQARQARMRGRRPRPETDLAAPIVGQLDLLADLAADAVPQPAVIDAARCPLCGIPLSDPTQVMCTRCTYR